MRLCMRAPLTWLLPAATSLAVLIPASGALGAPPDTLPAILVSRQLQEAERLRPGEVVWLSNDPSGAGARAFRLLGSYEPIPDPARLGEARFEARLHLPDLLRLTGDPRDPLSSESVGAVNLRLVDPRQAAAFSGELTARLPGLIVRPTLPDERSLAPLLVLERFHLAIAIVAVVASSLFLLALMVMLVDERRASVAVLRLIGLRRRRVLLQVLLEGLLIALCGVLFGVGLAVVLEGGFNRFFEWRFDTALVFVHVTPAIALRSALLALPLGMLAGLVSSWTLLRGDAVRLTRR